MLRVPLSRGSRSLLDGVGIGGDLVPAAVRQPPGQHSGLGHLQVPAGRALAPVVPPARRMTVALTGPPAPVERDHVINVAALRRPSASRRGTARIADLEQMLQDPAGTVGGGLPPVRTGTAFKPLDGQAR